MIETRGLTFRYKTATEPAIAGLDFEVAAREILGFLGPSGSGKSTTQKILIGLLEGYDGRVRVLDKDRAAWVAEDYERIGVSFETPNHFLKLTALENLRYFAALYRGKTRPLPELLERFDLGEAGSMPVGEYSKGMKNRLSVARCLLNDPELLFLDEPTAGLDPVNARNVKEVICEQQQAGKTVFLTTHDMTVAEELCDRVAFIVEGRIVLTDSPRALKLRHGRRTLQVEFTGADGRLQREEFPLDGLAGDDRFQRLLAEREIQTMHSREASLSDVFIRVTGRALQ